MECRYGKQTVAAAAPIKVRSLRPVSPMGRGFNIDRLESV